MSLTLKRAGLQLLVLCTLLASHSTESAAQSLAPTVRQIEIEGATTLTALAQQPAGPQ